MNSDTQPGIVVVLEPGLAATKRNRIRTRLEARGAVVAVVHGEGHDYLEVSGDHLPLATLPIGSWDGVAKVLLRGSEFPHASWGGGRGQEVLPTVVEVGGLPLGSGDFQILAGPCAVEDEDRLLRLAQQIQGTGTQVLRAGAFKPRTSPYSFQGLEGVGLEILARVKSETGMAIVTEVMDTRDVERVAEVADLLQVGSRNMQNYSLLKELGRQRKPVLLKRGFAATIREFLLAAEYLLSAGNDQVVLCERGIRSAAGTGQVVLDLGALPELRRHTHLPVVVDPSHGAGVNHRVLPLARAAVAAGADGVLVEVHDEPEEALSDGQQAILPQEFARLVGDLHAIRRALNEPAGKEEHV